MTAEFQLSLAPQTPETAAPGAREVLQQARTSLGFVPAMYATMANSPGLLQTYTTGYDAFRRASGFTAVEQEVVFLTLSRENGCAYCVAAHSTIADTASKVPTEVTDAIRDGAEIPDARLGALSRFVQVVFETRGKVGRADADAFLQAGFSEAQILEIVLATAVKTLSNYSNHLFHTEPDPAFAGRRWEGSAAAR